MKAKRGRAIQNFRLFTVISVLQKKTFDKNISMNAFKQTFSKLEKRLNMHSFQLLPFSTEHQFEHCPWRLHHSFLNLFSSGSVQPFDINVNSTWALGAEP